MGEQEPGRSEKQPEPDLDTLRAELLPDFPVAESQQSGASVEVPMKQDGQPDLDALKKKVLEENQQPDGS